MLNCIAVNILLWGMRDNNLNESQHLSRRVEKCQVRSTPRQGEIPLHARRIAHQIDRVRLVVLLAVDLGNQFLPQRAFNALLQNV